MKRRIKFALCLLGGLSAFAMLAFALAWVLFPLPTTLVAQYPGGTLLLDANGEVLRRTLDDEGLDCTPVSMAAGSDWAAKAIVAAEDKRFFRHVGIDPVAVLRSSVYNLCKGRVVTGASTISTQVIRMAEPRRRNLSTKLVEAFRAFQLERKLNKDGILEQYLNRAPLGGNLHGVESGSLRYFNKPASELSLGEAALLMGLPQSPSRLRPDRHLERALERRRYVLEKMDAQGAITAEQHAVALAQPVEVSWHDAPFRAPHFTDWLLREGSDRGVVKSTLDARFQAIAERENRQGAVVILEVATGNVLAMVGSPDYADAAAQGQVNGAVAARSPGSALKPFAYACAIEQGIYTPASVIDDRQITFAGYAPENYDQRFNGAVTLREALVHSLNIPAIECVRQTGLSDFYHLLRSVGLDSIDQPAEHYGLSLVLGTCETSLLALSNAYATFARGGNYLPVRARADAPKVEPMQVFAPGTCYLIADMLSGDERALAAEGHVGDVVQPRMAWKTGTSNGHRDAWTIAYNPEYVVGVWVGYPDGRSSGAFVGLRAAAPVAHRIFRSIYADRRAPWFERPVSVQERAVCVESGCPVGAACSEERRDLYVARISRHTPCPHSAEADSKLVMHSPPPQARYKLSREGLRGWRQAIPLRADGGEGRKLYWFVNGSAYTESQWELKPGQHRIRCVDDLHRSVEAVVTVE